jgi:hypothetical protein
MLRPPQPSPRGRGQEGFTEDMHRKRQRKTGRGRRLAASLALGLTAAAALLTGGARPAAAFGGEDPIKGNPWYHAEFSKEALEANGFSLDARLAIAWHADYVDSYLYNPLWWAPGGVKRFRASLATYDELAKLHFDDLYSSDQVHRMFRHYTSGTVAGLIWAAKNNDVAAAQNILGVSLHAIQDFYSHSNWVDAPERRTRTYFQTPYADRQSLTLFTGAYEHPEHTGIKSHGKYAPMCSILMQPGVSQLMDLASSGFSPLSNSPMVAQYKACKEGKEVQPYVPLTKKKVTLPPGILYQAPAGIALDTSWLAPIAAEERGITDVDPETLFGYAKSNAVAASKQWIGKLDKVMRQAGYGKFWDDLKSTPASMDVRTTQYEDFKRFPYTFLSAGEYPPKQNIAGSYANEEFYLRLTIKTAGTVGAGTDSDIRLQADGRDYLLDYMPRATPVLGINDFEMGDEMVYVAGPFSKMPSSISFKNDSADTGQILESLGRAFAEKWKGIKSTALSVIAGHADKIGTNKQVWFANDLAQIPASGKTFAVPIDGKDEGSYTVHGTIRRTAQSPGNDHQDWAEYEIKFTQLECVRESKWDRGSNSDEPFVMALVNPLPGAAQRFRTEPFSDVDKGETRAMDQTFTVRVPKRYGVISIPLAVFESDDEGKGERDELLKKFADDIEDETDADERGFLTALGTAVAADWKIAALKVDAWSRGGGTVKVGTVFGARNADGTFGLKTVDKWVDGGKTVSLPMDVAGLQDTGVKVTDLITGYGDGETPPPADPVSGQLPVNGDWRPLGSSFAVRLDSVEYGAPKNDRKVEVAVTYKNITSVGKRLTAANLQTFLDPREGSRWPVASSALTLEPGPDGTTRFNYGDLPAGGEIAVRYTFEVGDAAAQRRVNVISLYLKPTKVLNVTVGEEAYTSIQLPQLPAAPPPPADPEPSADAVKDLKRFAGKYKTSEGTVITVRAEGKYLTATGVTEESYNTNYPSQAESWQLGLQPDNKTLEGLWSDRRKAQGQSGYLGRAKLTFSADARSFTGSVQPSSGFAPFTYTGTRLEEGANNGSTGSDNGSNNGTGNPTAGGFSKVDQYFAVRLDSFKRRRPDSVEAVLSVRNVSPRDARVEASSLKVLTQAADAAVQYRFNGNIYAATGDVPMPLPTYPILRPGQEVQIRYVFADVPDSVTRLKQMTVGGYGKSPVTFDLGGYDLTLPKEANGGPAGASMSLKYYDVTLEELKRNAAGEWEAVLTVKNAHASRLGLTASEVTMFLLDGDGVSFRNVGNLYKASVTDDLERVTNTLWMETGDSVRVRLHFPGTKGFTPTRFRLSDRVTKTADLPASVVK